MLKKWLNNWLNGDNNETLVVSPEENILSGLNLKEVLDAHNDWKIKLENELTGSSATPIDVTILTRQQCILGSAAACAFKTRRTGTAAVTLRQVCPTQSVEAQAVAQTCLFSVAWALWIRVGSVLRHLPRE